LIVLGILLALVGYFCLIPILETIGIILVVLGVLLFVFSSVSGPVGGRRYWW
jgi:hypothetical protein